MFDFPDIVNPLLGGDLKHGISEVERFLPVF